VGVQDVRGSDPVGKCLIFYRKGNKNHELGTGFFVQRKIITAVKSVASVSDRMSYIILRGYWFHITVLNIHAPTVDKIDNVKYACGCVWV
jgi:hypothetical protein